MTKRVDPYGDGCPDLGIVSCLQCPLPYCRYEYGSGVALAISRSYLVGMYLAQGMTIQQIADTMGLSRRTIFRLKLRPEASLPVLR
jgi:hypothetical protein